MNKRVVKFLILSICVIGLYYFSYAQNLLNGGNMEDAGVWTVAHLNSVDVTEYEFNYSGTGPSEGAGGYLYVTCSGTQETNVFFYQELSLLGGTEYEFSGAFADLAGNITNFWCEVLYDTVAIPTDADFDGILVLGFNTWDGTEAGVDGTFQDDYVKGDGPVFTAPGAVGEAVTVYFGVNVGCWLGGTDYYWEVAIDELSLMPTATSIEQKSIETTNNFQLNQNYPNPFNPITSLSYSLAEPATITLLVYDLGGREVAVLVDNEYKEPGNYQLTFNADQLPSGVYFCRLISQASIRTRKMVLLK